MTSPHDSVRRRTARAIKSGRLVRPDHCSKCNWEGLIQAHHPNYDQPLNVIWLCQSCHCDLHRKDTLEFVLQYDLPNRSFRLVQPPSGNSVAFKTLQHVKKYLDDKIDKGDISGLPLVSANSLFNIYEIVSSALGE